VTIFVLIDALGWEVLKEHRFLNDELPYRVPLRTILGFSSGAIPTMLTGEPPAVTGHWNLFYYDPAGSPFRWLRRFAFLPDAILDNRLTRKLVKEAGRRFLGMGPNFECCVSPRVLPYFNFLERRDIYGRRGILNVDSIIDQLADAGVRYRVYTYHQWTDEEILSRAVSDVSTRAAEFFLVYLCEMDSTLHDHWGDRGRLQDKLDWYAVRLRQLFDAALRSDPNARLIITSDHGMAPVRHHYDLARDVASLRLKLIDDYLAVYDSTMARFWCFSERARQAISQLLLSLSCGRILPDDELARLGVFFPDRRYGEIIFLLHPGWIFAKSDFHGTGWMPAGMHGYHPADASSDAIFLSNLPPSVEVRSVADVFHCLREEVLGARTQCSREVGERRRRVVNRG
jgi:hypothetical protein